MKSITYLLIISLLIVSCKDNQSSKTESVSTTTETVDDVVTETTNFKVTPIMHATMVLDWDGTIIYVDPVGGKQAFEGQPEPDLILVTDIHGDHLDVKTLEAVSVDKSKLIVPQAVADKLPGEFDAQVDVLNNGDHKERFGFDLEAIPMYNLREEALKFHEKGRGNGYVIEKEGERVYISGDTEDIPEMKALENIDVAFVCMNLPYTMTEIQAGRAVVAFKPKTVYPYHYRGATGFSNVESFKAVIENSNARKDIKVIALNWYPVTSE